MLDRSKIRRAAVLAAAACLLSCGGKTTTPGARGTVHGAGSRARARATVRTDVLPIPDTRGVIEVDVPTVLAAPLLRPWVKRALKKLSKRGAGVKAQLARCGLRFDRDVTTFAMDAPSGPNSHDPGIYVIGGRFRARQVLDCLERWARKNGKPGESP